MAISRTQVLRGAAAATAALLVAALAACTPAGGGGSSDSSTIEIGWNSDLAPFGYDPLQYSDGQRIFFEGLYDGLGQLQPDGSVAPNLATSFEYNEDMTVLTMALADGVEFADGSTLTADLVKANLDRRSDPALVAYNPFAAGGPSEIASVDVVDESTVAVTFAGPQPGFENNLGGVAGMIVGQSGLDDPDSLGTTPDGSGPFTLDDSTVKGTSYVLEKKADHPQADEYAYDTMVFKPITDPQARTNSVISGQTDAAFIATSTAELADSKGLGISQVGGTVVSMLVFDKSGVTAAAFADPNVRVALGMAIDRDALVSGVHPGDVPAVNALPKDNPGFDPAIDDEFGYNPDKAKELLETAGYGDGFSFTIVSTPDVQTDLEAIQTNFAAVGVTMDIKPATSTEEAFGAVQTTPLGILPLDWGNPVGTMFGVILGFANPHGEVNPALFGATQAVAGAQSDADRTAALQGLNRELVSSGWLIPVYEQLTTWAFNDTVAPVEFPAGGSFPLLRSFKPAE